MYVTSRAHVDATNAHCYGLHGVIKCTLIPELNVVPMESDLSLLGISTCGVSIWHWIHAVC